jgi:FkbM family methyltransferase
MIQDKEYSRFKWSHNLWLHRMLVRLYNHFMKFVPFGIKYGIGRYLRKDKPPYFLIRPGSVVVQIGAPKDTLNAGRSRGMYFILFSGSKGKAILVEPDQDSLAAYQRVCRQRGLGNAEFIPSAAWSDTRLLRVYINDAHPATNFIEGTVDYSQDRLKEYRVVEIPASTVDQILGEHKLHQADLVSITTNGSERAILIGMANTIANGLPYISLARTGEGYMEMMASIGYQLYTHDDRGFTFRQEKTLNKRELKSIL